MWECIQSNTWQKFDHVGRNVQKGFVCIFIFYSKTDFSAFSCNEKYFNLLPESKKIDFKISAGIVMLTVIITSSYDESRLVSYLVGLIIDISSVLYEYSHIINQSTFSSQV